MSIVVNSNISQSIVQVGKTIADVDSYNRTLLELGQLPLPKGGGLS